MNGLIMLSDLAYVDLLMLVAFVLVNLGCWFTALFAYSVWVVFGFWVLFCWLLYYFVFVHTCFWFVSLSLLAFGLFYLLVLGVLLCSGYLIWN